MITLINGLAIFFALVAYAVLLYAFLMTKDELKETQKYSRAAVLRLIQEKGEMYNAGYKDGKRDQSNAVEKV